MSFYERAESVLKMKSSGDLIVYAPRIIYSCTSDNLAKAKHCKSLNKLHDYFQPFEIFPRIFTKHVIGFYKELNV